MLVIYNTRGMLTYPTLAPLNRAALTRGRTKETVVELPRSGRRIRTLAAGDNGLHRKSCDPSVKTFRTAPEKDSDRTWELPVDRSHNKRRHNPIGSRRLAGELAYVAQPLAHLTTLAIFGEKSWTPWTLSLGCDLLRQAEISHESLNL